MNWPWSKKDEGARVFCPQVVEPIPTSVTPGSCWTLYHQAGCPWPTFLVVVDEVKDGWVRYHNEDGKGFKFGEGCDRIKRFLEDQTPAHPDAKALAGSKP